MRQVWRRVAAALLAALVAAPALPALAQQRGGRTNARSAGQPQRGGRVLPAIDYTEFFLPNGLRVVLHEDRSTPIVATNVWYHVGSKNEVPGRTGFAHLFEHMMFQGSKNYNNDYFMPMQEAGALLNGTTNADRTNYWEVMPSNFLELALFMEADRMGGLLEAMTQEKLDNQIAVVQNEKRQRYDNAPYGLVGERIAKEMYPPDHPYHWLTIGSLEDLAAASLDDVKDFFRRYYTPNNASLVISGDFDSREARRLVEKHFGPIPKGPAPVRPKAAQPALAREVRVEMEDRVQLPRVYMVWHSVPHFTKDEAALDTLAAVLGGGKSSRLFKSLVYDRQIAQQVSAFHASREIAGQFQIVVTGKPDTTPQQLEEAIKVELARLVKEPPTAEEVQRAYNSREAAFVYGLQTVGGFGGKDDQLNQYATYLNSPGYFEQDLARYRTVTPAVLRRVAAQYLTDKRLVLSVVPARSPRQRASAAEPVPASPREAIAPPSQQTSGQQQPGNATGEARPPAPSGVPSDARPAATNDPPAGAQTMTRAEAAATRPAGATPPAASAPSAPPQEQPARPNTVKKAPAAVDASKLPKPGPNPKFTLPPVQRRKLSNGLEVLVVEHHELPVVNMNLVVKTGGAADPAGRGGLAALVADLLDEGTKSRSALQISDELADIGSSLGVTAGWDSTGANLRTLKRHLDRSLAVYADVVLNPAFPEAELDRLRASRMGAFRQRRDDPSQIAGMVYASLVFGQGHPYGHTLAGNEQTVGAVTAADVRKFYETFYRPNNAALIVVGDTTPDEIVPKLERAFGGWERAHVPAVDVSAAPARRDRSTIYVVDRPGSAQSIILAGHIGVPRSNPDYFPLLVLNNLLGGLFTSRINMNLREEKGYTYGARSTFDFRRGAGAFSASAPVFTGVTREALSELLGELNAVRGARPVMQAEMEFAKQALIRGFPRTFETPAQIADRLETIVTYDLPDTYFNRYIESVERVTLEDINRAAERHLRPDRLAVVVVGDRRAIEQGLRSLDDIGRTVTFLDAEGRPADSQPATGAGTGSR
ncbi:MAG TPA: insulinase family protein [Pyrinomonadaceae bacterium]|nr:insulinase family protein [Pyrinomonadaceae bacterium]